MFEDDDVRMMEVLSSFLHFKSKPSYLSLEPRQVMELAIHSDKYDCTAAMTPWISVWMSTIKTRKEERDIAHLISAAFIFRSPIDLLEVIRIGIRHLFLRIVYSWLKSRDSSGVKLDMLPTKILGTFFRYRYIDRVPSNRRHTPAGTLWVLCENISHIINTLHKKLQSVLGEETKDGFLHASYSMKECPLCHHTFLSKSKRCNDCGGIGPCLETSECSAAMRLGLLIAYLKPRYMWPSVDMFHKKSATEVMETLRTMSLDRPHFCDGGSLCPLEKLVGEFTSIW